MSRTGTAVLLAAALGLLLFVHPAEGALNTPLAPRVKGVVLSCSDGVLIVDQVLRSASRQSRTAKILISPRTRISGRRSAAAAIRVQDLIRADGIQAADGSLEALNVEVVLTADEVSVGRPAQTNTPGLLWRWIFNGGLTFPLR
jgi:hypothetical protein